MGSIRSGFRDLVAYAPQETQNRMQQFLDNVVFKDEVTPALSAQAALTAQLTTITNTAPGTADYAIADLTNVIPYGFVSQDEGRTVLSVIANLQTRLAELETKLKTLGLLS